jgi:RecQ-mediated genome instability protein 1
MAANISTEIISHLNARHLHPTSTWLKLFIDTQRANAPIAALKQTALFRLLASDITVSLAQPAETNFPRDILSGNSQSRYLAGPIICQVLDIEDIGHSRWSQVEAIEAQERGETTKGREIVRVVPGEDGGQQPQPRQNAESKGPFKLLLQDAKGVKVFGIDLTGIAGIGMTMNLGVKILLRNCDVRRGVVMLEPGKVQILGGKIEALDKAWKEGRKERLMRTAKEGLESG